MSIRSVFDACRRRAVPLVAAVGVLGACADPHEDKGDIILVWDEGGGDWGAWMQSSNLIQDSVAALNQYFKLPRDLLVFHTKCGAKNASYDPRSRELTMCYELLQAIAELDSEQDQADRVKATWQFIFLHEIGHALVDYYGLPIATDAEDAADNFAALQMMDAGLGASVYLAAEYWKDTGNHHYTERSFAGEHSLNPQRFYNVICLLYGSRPVQYQELRTTDILPAERVDSCPREYDKAHAAWQDMLDPWIK